MSFFDYLFGDPQKRAERLFGESNKDDFEDEDDYDDDDDDYDDEYDYDEDEEDEDEWHGPLDDDELDDLETYLGELHGDNLPDEVQRQIVRLYNELQVHLTPPKTEPETPPPSPPDRFEHL